MNELFEKLKSLCAEVSEDMVCELEPPATQDEIDAWQKQNGRLPEDYAAFLRCANGARFGWGNEIFGLSSIGDSDEYEGYPDGCHVIAEYIGDGPLLLAEKDTCRIIGFDHGEEDEFDSFAEWIELVLIDLLEGQ